jgi:hypothetical protein
MDPLTIAVSTVSVVAFLAQLAEYAKKLHRTWSSLENIILDVNGIVGDIDRVNRILDQLLEDERRHEDRFRGQIVSIIAMETCQANMKELEALTRGICSSLQPRTAAFRSDQVERFRKTLESTKTFLILLKLSISEYDTCSPCCQVLADRDSSRRNVQHFEITTEGLTRLAVEQAAILAATQRSETRLIELDIRFHGSELSSSTRATSRQTAIQPIRHRVATKVYRTTFGVVVLITQARRIASRFGNSQWRDVEEWTVRFVPSRIIDRICGRGIDLSISWSSSTSEFHQDIRLQPRLRYYPVIPATARIFETCKVGDVQGVLSLFNNREASVFDVNPEGWTPLHVCEPLYGWINWG